MSDTTEVTVLQFPNGNGLAQSAEAIGREMNAGEPALPLCRDCRWCKTASYGSFECHAPQNFKPEISLVTGERNVTATRVHCSVHRMYDTLDDHCGKSGRWFSPRQNGEKQ